MKYIVLILLSSFLTAASFYCCDVLIFFSLIPWIYVLFKLDSAKKRFLLGFLWGLIYFTHLCYWLIDISLLGLVFLIIYLSCYPAVFSVLCKPRTNPVNIYYVSGLWVTLEFIRSFLFTGFPWAYLGYALAKRTALIQIADITGVYGVSFLILLFNGVIFYLFTKQNLRKKMLHLFILCLVFASSFIYSRYRLKTLTPQDIIEDVALVQTNINSHFKWDLSFYEENLERFKLLSLIAKYKDAKFIILPETILPYAWNHDQKIMQDITSIVKEVKVSTLLGIPFYKDGKLYNSSLFLNEEGELIDFYFKTHLVPFGEYTPLKLIFSFLDNIYPIGSYEPGENIKLFNYQGHPFSVLICYEDIFPNLIRRATVSGSHFLINQSDEGWFKERAEIYLHNQIAVFRAIENRRSLIRATNTGLTCFIDYKGNVIKQLQPFKADVLVSNLPIHTGFSFYTEYGWVFAWLVLILTFCYWAKSKCGILRGALCSE